MSLTWVRPIPLLFMTASLLLMWTPSRAFLGAAISKLPRLVLSKRRRYSAATDHRCSTTLASAAGQDREVGEARRVIVITGPTATGKSSIALEVCKELDGEIISCDSVQVYSELSIGCNKPSEQDMQGVPHHLVDIAALSETFTAGEFVAHAQEAIDDILARGKVPVVVGGTMMYVQWLVHGKPDAPKKDRAVAQTVANELLPYHERGDWDGALQILAAASKMRAASLSRNDWYRLSRSLEVLRGANGEDAFTGLREPLDAKYDFRSFFVVGDRERLFRRIDRRCEEMINRGLLSEVAGLVRRGVLDPASPAGRSIGYRQTMEFLEQEEKFVDFGNESRAPTGRTEDVDDRDARFLQFFMTFAARTRQYAADQMKWFRSPKGRDFYWQLWDLGGPIREGTRRGTRRNGQGVCSLVQVSRAGDGCSWQDVAKAIAERYRLSREAFEEELGGEYQEAVRLENQMRAKDMKVYSTELSLLADGSSTRWRLGEEMREIAKKAREAQTGTPEGVERRMRGWHAGSR